MRSISLDLHILSTVRLGWVPALLQQMSRTHVEEAQFMVGIPDIAHIEALDWGALDQIFSNAMRLRTLRVIVHRAPDLQAVVESVRNRMPLCHARKVLQVEQLKVSVQGLLWRSF